MLNTFGLVYSVKEALKMTTEEFGECAELFSNSYGRYSQESPIRPGENVKMGLAFFERRFKKENIYIAMVRNNDRLIGQAAYIRKKYDDVGTMTWVMQLVVDERYRKHGVGSTLLRSIWGFSNDFAWGLATANPCTVKALESATFRQCCPYEIQKNLKYVKRLSDEIAFVKEDGFFVDEKSSIANTNFYIDNSEFLDNGNDEEWKLGELKPGYEWLAFTFRSQAINTKKYQCHFDDMVRFSERKLQDAYGRMKMKEHPWAKGHINELDTIFEKIPDKNIRTILDLGCGIGRHSIELSKRGYCVTGVDFSHKNILTARRSKKKNEVLFLEEDARYFQNDSAYDFVLCLYDVIGSFPDTDDNRNILYTIYKNLKRGGYCAISVMNMELTKSIVENEQIGNVLEQPELLYSLKPSETMQSSGNIFNPEYIVIDEKNDLVYRKEQFMDDEELPAEYIIRDKRYTAVEIKELIQSVGLVVCDYQYVQAGHFDKPLSACDKKAKEILVIAKRAE